MTAELLDEDLTDVATGPLVSQVQVAELFGRYNYTIKVPQTPTGEASRLLLLYGDNGSGKTTVLRLLWHLLSPANNRGHRSAVSRVPFRHVSVTFTDGTTVSATKSEGLVGTFEMSLIQPPKEPTVVRFESDDQGRVTSSGGLHLTFGDTWVRHQVGFEPEIPEHVQRHFANQAAEEALLDFLRDSNINPLFLADDRSLYTDDEEVERARERADHRDQLADPKRVRHGSNSAVVRELRLTVARVNELLRSLTLSGQNVGSAGANTIYGDVLRQLAATPGSTGAELATSVKVRASNLLKQLAARSPKFEEFELVPHFAADEFSQLLQEVPPDHRDLAYDIVTPYLNSLWARMEALEEAEKLLRSLLSLLNDFLVDKQFTFSPRRGLEIVTRDGLTLSLSSLSSGERQLTMLLCTTILARRDSRLFIIDEPELSLGIPWQRKVLGSLLTLTEGTSLQFIVATHSVEMISSQRQHLVRLDRDEQQPAE